MISVYHLEAGEYMLEFEAEDMETFRMAIAAMGGATITATTTVATA